MSRKKKNKKYIIPYWANFGKNNKFVPLYIGMLQSPAYKSLTHRQKNLYTYMRLQYSGTEIKFEFNWAKANQVYELYSNKESFYNDINALISSGFIICVECGVATRTKSIYAFSNNWQLYPNIKLDARDMTSSMIKKQKMAVTKQ